MVKTPWTIVGQGYAYPLSVADQLGGVGQAHPWYLLHVVAHQHGLEVRVRARSKRGKAPVYGLRPY